MPVITISREYGSVDDDFGERVAQALGYPCVGKEFIGDVLAQYGMIEFEREYETKPSFWSSLNLLRDDRRDEVVAMLNQVLQAVAQHGNVVIQGRSGFAALAGFADVLHVRLQAPLEARIDRVATQQQLTLEEAARIVNEADDVRTGFVEGFYGVAWDAIHAFDLVINAHKVSGDTAIAWVVEAAKAVAARPTSDAPSTSALVVDDILAREVSRQFERGAAHC